MDFSEDWKSLWPISAVYPAPLLNITRDPPPPTTTTTTDTTKKQIGPTVFNPSPQTLTQLYSSPHLSLHLPNPFTPLTLSRFIQTSTTSILPTKASSIASQFGPQNQTVDQFLNFNSLQLLRCPDSASFFAFFLNGENFESIGFLVLSVENSSLVVNYDKLVIDANDENSILDVKVDNGAKFRIRQLVVNPVGDFSGYDSSEYTCVGYLIATTLYRVCWYAVKICGVGSDDVSARLDYLGDKEFKSCAVVYACWSSHIREESLVLLENGELFLFDVESGNYVGKRIRVCWDKYGISKKGNWLSCEFSWCPRILIVAHSSAVFLIDLTSEKCIVSRLLRIETLFDWECIENDQFVAFAKACDDGFHFTVASNHLLFLCDVRKPQSPLLRWSHSLSKPNYITVFRLSELRSNSRENEYGWASEAGFGILMGSFRNSDFGLFCFGPDTRGCSTSPIPRIGSSFYAWELPSDLQLGGDCHCGNCLVNTEFWKGTLPEWVDWRQKKEVIFGFGILDKDLLAQLSAPNGLGGFMLIRLTSCGKLESQSYSASWENAKDSEREHVHPSCFEDSLLYGTGEAEYHFPKKYKYLEFKWLNAFMESGLGILLSTELKRTPQVGQNKLSFGSDFHENICQKLKDCGLNRLKGTLEVDDVFKEISLPTSIYEISLSCVWSRLPANLLRLGFCTYSEVFKVPSKLEEMPVKNQRKRKGELPLEFLEVPDKPQLPPFSFRKPSSQTNKWSNKRLSADSLLGPVVPLPFLATISNLGVAGVEKSFADMELELECDKVMEMAREVCKFDSSSQVPNDHAVSLADDKDDLHYGPSIEKQFSSYRPTAFSKKKSLCEDERHTTVVYKAGHSNDRSQMDNQSQLFDSQCPVELKFDGPTLEFSPKEEKAYKLLKKQYTKFKQEFNMYQKSDFQK